MEYEIDEATMREWNSEYRDVIYPMTDEAKSIIARQINMAFQKGVETGKSRIAGAVWALA